MLALTREGERVQRALWERLMTDSPVAAGLDREDQRVLLGLLQRVVVEQERPDCARPPSSA